LTHNRRPIPRPSTYRASRRLWYSAAAGGALSALETIAGLAIPVREIRGIIKGTCRVALDAWSGSKTLHDAIAEAQAEGFAELDPMRDLSGQDSADKLSLLIEPAFGEWIDPGRIVTHGIDSIPTDPNGYKLIARARKSAQGVIASVAPEIPPAGSFLGQARSAENRLESELEIGEVVRLRAQGTGRWPTTASLIGDLHEIARLVETRRQSRIEA
jgi:homoserine dehydrogenase